MVSPPKPWERNGALAAASSSLPTPSSAAPAPAPATAAPAATSNPTTATASSSSAPAVPTRPAAFGATQPTNALATTAYSPYNSFGTGYSPYQSSMYGGGMGYGGYGGYGGMGGGMYGGGMGYGGYGGMGMGGMYGRPGMMDPNNPSLTQTLETTTQTTFALLHSVVQTFAGMAQMLESTFMATHSSFFALAGVVDQFAQLRNALGGVLGLFGLVRWLKDLLTGRNGAGAMRGEFRDFVNGRPVQGPPPNPAQPKASRKPIIIFFLAIFGIPYAMHKLVRLLAERQPAPLPPLDPSQLTFARAKYPFTSSSAHELQLAENEIVAIMGKLNPITGQEVDPRHEIETEWWKGRTREGREGWFPRSFVEVLERKTKAVDQPAQHQVQLPVEPKKID
ncbi:unnamed protein product [Peniophora sp. CBMAI 1063]|nr:unnamed protein product [Peniophora sp. CBMAI 1063]